MSTPRARWSRPVSRWRSIFSQELLSSQTEYLAARKHRRFRDHERGGRQRADAAHVLGMTPAEIDAIEQTGEPHGSSR
jgi:hypothetical protein